MCHFIIFVVLFYLVYNHKVFSYGVSNSDVELNSFQFIHKYGYKAEEHQVITEDGYVVTLFRMVNKGPPLALVHGIGDSSDSWLLLGPKRSLAYQLADAGYDIWLYNARGNKYSRGSTKNFTEKQYWDFSYEEMGSKDLPATIDYILNKTSHEKLTYVGYSQGTTIFFIMCSMRPSYNEKINHAVLLAPVAWIRTITHPLIKIVSDQLVFLVRLFESVGMFEIFSKNTRAMDKGIVCNSSLLEKLYCNMEYFFNYGISNINNLPPDKFEVIDSHIPAGASTKSFAHFIQGYKSQNFQRFDYGFFRNLLIYSSPIPPSYDLSLVRIPVSIISSEVDWLSDKQDVKILTSKLRSIKRFIVLNRTLDFTHIEFVYGSRVKSLINDPVFNIIKTELG